jgi:hypothetical protein
MGAGMRRLIPAYVEKPAWAVYDAFAKLDTSDLDPDDLDALGDAVNDLRAALERGDALAYAPAYVLAQIFNRR